MVQFTNLPNCCGVWEAGNFPLSKSLITKQFIKEFYQQCLLYNEWKLIISTLNHKQKPVIEPVLKSLGFKIKCVHKNSTGSTIYTYFLRPGELKKPE